MKKFFVTQDQFQSLRDVESILEQYDAGGWDVISVQYHYQATGPNFVTTTMKRKEQ